MALLEDVIQDIGHPQLRERILSEVRKLKSEKHFGLVFEEHLPEVVPLFDVPIARGSMVAKRAGPMHDIFRVITVGNGLVTCIRELDPSTTSHSFAVAELVVVKRFGEAIYPTLTPVIGVERASDRPNHILIEADNYHALQLMEYIYGGKVDCIYIDPPYNTGARDWKYNNDFVDDSDAWRHSKWLSFMRRRLRIAGRLLNPRSSVLIVTIDEHEVHHLGCLLADLFPEARRQMVTIVNNAAGVSQGGFYRVEEYAFFCFFGDAKPVPGPDDLLSDERTSLSTPIWFSMIRYGGIDGLPSRRPGLVYPIAIDPRRNRIMGVGRTLQQRVDSGEVTGNLNAWRPDPSETVDGHPVVWPYRKDGSLYRWQIGPETVLDLATQGFVRVREQSDGPGGNRWSIAYVKSGNQKKVRDGEIPILGREDDEGALILGEASRMVVPKTVWRRVQHDAGKWGSRTIRELLGEVSFDYAKSPYAVLDTLAAVVGNKPDALVVDFFAGSGTTLHALALLNKRDGGHRKCVLVTNNEVSDKEAQRLLARGVEPNTPAWAEHGICRAVTFPRCVSVLTGSRPDGTPLPGVMPTGRRVQKTTSRQIRPCGGFFDQDAMWDVSVRKQFVAAIGLTQSKVDDSDWYISEDEEVSILWNPDLLDDYRDALAEEGRQVSTILINLPDGKQFKMAREKILSSVPPLVKEEDEYTPLANGFQENIHYFRLDLLDPTRVKMGEEFPKLLPTLWLMAGGSGPIPVAAGDEPFLLPDGNPFAVLLNQTYFRAFVRQLERLQPQLNKVFLVTDDTEAFYGMKSDIQAVIELKDDVFIQLYRNYLQNFRINTGGRQS